MRLKTPYPLLPPFYPLLLTITTHVQQGPIIRYMQVYLIKEAKSQLI